MHAYNLHVPYAAHFIGYPIQAVRVDHLNRITALFNFPSEILFAEGDILLRVPQGGAHDAWGGLHHTTIAGILLSFCPDDRLITFAYLSTSFVWICVHVQQGCQSG